MSDWSASLRRRGAVAPPLALTIDVAECSPEMPAAPADSPLTELEPISGFTCVIEYGDAQRLISCRSYKLRGDHSYIGAICLKASGYRDFRTDRITAVIEPQTGEVLGGRDYFARFAFDDRSDAATTWGLPKSGAATLAAGLNVLAFMAHCDGRWHPLESEPVERFVCSLWLRCEWESDPPLAEIMAHAQRLSPDGETFLASIDHYARSEACSRVLRQAVTDLIAADGVICDQEFNWGTEFSHHLTERMETLRQAAPQSRFVLHSTFNTR